MKLEDIIVKDLNYKLEMKLIMDISYVSINVSNLESLWWLIEV